MAETETSLPSAPLVDLGQNVVIQPPLSRCGRGPGLIIVRPIEYSQCHQKNDSLDPEPIKKLAEESYAVVQITVDHGSSDPDSLLAQLNRGIDGLASQAECSLKDKFGLLIYGSPANYAPRMVETFRTALAAAKNIAVMVFFSQWDIPTTSPVLAHLAGDVKFEDGDNLKHYSYSDVSSASFMIPGHPEFKISSAGVAHSRTLSFLKKHLGGPYFDLEKIWDEHTFYEFGDRSVEKTMATMVDEPYVNHIPTLTGGIGRAALSKFYLNHFIFNNPDDTALELISRTVGVDRVVDEFIFCFTHNKQVDWLIPGVPPTGKPLRIPFTAIVNIRGDRLYHEHIAWDQATVLVQLGLMPEYLPYPYAVEGKLPAPGKRFEYRVPAAGVESAQKLENEHSLPSNKMLEFAVREVD